MLHKEIKMQPWLLGKHPARRALGHRVLTSHQGWHASVAVSSCASKNGYPSASQAVSHREMGRGCPPETRGVLAGAGMCTCPALHYAPGTPTP